jgi:glyoxylase-like metal-dependent hydrolase (beta-lactamase superfamily II)
MRSSASVLAVIESPLSRWLAISRAVQRDRARAPYPRRPEPAIAVHSAAVKKGRRMQVDTTRSRVVQNWYVVTEVGNGITVISEPFHAEDVKSFLVEGERDVALIDTGLGIGDFPALVAELTDKQPIVLQTHGHWDHIGHSYAYERVLIHPSEVYTLQRGFPNEMFRGVLRGPSHNGTPYPPGFDPDTAAIPPCWPSGTLDQGDRVDLGGRVLEVFHTPGHSPGGLTFLDREARALFTGDVVQLASLWVFLPRSDASFWRDSLRTLANLADQVDAVYPSHNGVPVPPEAMVEIAAAYEEIWHGHRRPDRKEYWDIGFPEKVPVDVFDYGRFYFLLGTGRYGEGANPGWPPPAWAYERGKWDEDSGPTTDN